MINLIDNGAMLFETKSGKKVLKVTKVHKYSNNQGTYINLELENRVVSSSIVAFRIEICEFTASGALIKKMEVKRSGVNFSYMYDFADDLIQIDEDCEKIEINIIEADFINFIYRENGFVQVEKQKENISLEIGEFKPIRKRLIHVPYVFLTHALFIAALLTIICFFVYIYLVLGGR